MKKISVFLCMCFSFLLLFATVASAISLQLGPYKIKYANYETLSTLSAGGVINPLPVPTLIPIPDNQGTVATQPGGPGTDVTYYNDDGDLVQDNWGIFDVTSFAPYPSGGSWWSDTQPEEVTGEFYGIDIQSWFYDASTDLMSIDSVGGQLDLYYDPSDNFDPTLPGTATDGTLMVSFDFVPGIDPGSDITIDGNMDGSTFPSTGDAVAYLSVIPASGAWADFFDGNYWPVTWTDDILGVQTGFADAKIRSDFEPNTFPSIPFDLISDDPVIGSIVPEPATMLLLGSGLIGLAGFGRRKKFFKKD